MNKKARVAFNKQFSETQYDAFLSSLSNSLGVEPAFRIAETPIFFDEALINKLKDYAEQLIAFLERPDFKEISDRAIPDQWRMPNEGDFSNFLCIDFGITQKENGELEPQLVEIQGFPSLMAFQYLLYKEWSKNSVISSTSTPFIDCDEDEFLAILDEFNKQPGTILLEIEPEKQNTFADLKANQILTEIPVVCVKNVVQKGRKLFYTNDKGEEIQIQRIMNRVIFDELEKREDLNLNFSFTDELDVEWLPHPNWYYRISKFILPYMDFDFVPKTYFLHELKSIPEDLENYVLKPLFSFSGSGVIIDVKPEDIKNIKDPENYILQRKINYEPIIESPDAKVKLEVRILAVQSPSMPKAKPIINIIRMTQGKMVGVKYNKDKKWVGGTIGFSEKN